jgi:hypothetical protein
MVVQGTNEINSFYWDIRGTGQKPPGQKPPIIK